MKWNRKKAVVTGGAGFIGSVISRTLISMGSEVTVVDDLSTGVREAVPVESNFIRSKVEDLPLKAFEGVDYVFHFGSPSSTSSFLRSPSACFSSTLASMMYVLKAGEKAGVRKVIYPSSGSVYGRTRRPQSEKETTPAPMSLYGWAKLGCEHLAGSFIDSVASVGMRIFACYGPGEERKKEGASVVTLFMEAILGGESPVVFGTGDQRRDFVFLDDVVVSSVRLAESDFCGIVNIGTGLSHSYRQLLAMIGDCLGESIRARHIPEPSNYVRVLQADTKLMKQVLRINPLPLQKGIEFTAKNLHVRRN